MAKQSWDDEYPAGVERWRSPVLAGSSGRDDDAEDAGGARSDGVSGERDLDISIEVWDDADLGVERVIALTSHRTIAFAAYYAAKDQYPGRTIVIRDRFGVIARWPARRM